MANIKTTLKDPVSQQSTEFEKDFDKTMIKSAPDVNLTEVDGMLGEAEQSLKKKIFSLAKMESLVFSDPKLSAVYDEMSENGEEKYGYHYNETIMNMLFNDYVLNSPKYLQKYKMSIPKEKKRRDKSGINQLKKAGQKKQDATGTVLNKGDKKDVDESTSAGSAGGAAGYVGYAGPAAWGKTGDLSGDFKKKKGNTGKPISTMASLSESNYLTDPSGFANFINEIDEQNDADFIPMNSQAYGTVDNMNPNDQKIIRNDIETGKWDDNSNIEDGIALNEKSKSQQQQKFMGMVHAIQKGELSPDKVSPKMKKVANDMNPDDVEDFASTKHKGLPKEIDEALSLHDTVEYVSDREGEEPFDMHGIKWQFVNAKYPDGKVDIGVYRYGHDLVYDYAKWQDEMGINENNIKEDTQTMIQNNGSSMANTGQPIGDLGGDVPMGTQATGGLQETEDLFEELNRELEAFEVHHNKLKIMAEDRKPSALVLRDRLGSENEKNFKKDIQSSGTKEVIDVQKELEWKDQQTDIKDPQKLGNDIEKQAIKNSDMKSGEALKNVGDSANNNGDEIPKRNLTTDEQEEVNLYRNGQHSINYDNEPNERFVERMKADQGEFYEMGEKQKEFKSDAPMYNKDNTFVEDAKEDKVQYDKNNKKSGDKVAWNERMGIGSNVKLNESMVTGRYIDALGKRRLIEFRLSEVETGEINENLMKLSFDGLGNTYHSKSVDGKVIVNESVVNLMKANVFYTDGNKIFAQKRPVQNINESVENKKTVVNEQQEKMKHLLGYEPKNYINTKNIKL